MERRLSFSALELHRFCCGSEMKTCARLHVLACVCMQKKKKKKRCCVFSFKKKIINTLSLADKYINAINTDLPRKYI